MLPITFWLILSGFGLRIPAKWEDVGIELKEDVLHPINVIWRTTGVQLSLEEKLELNKDLNLGFNLNEFFSKQSEIFEFPSSEMNSAYLMNALTFMWHLLLCRNHSALAPLRPGACVI
jgi:hypothetical protein